MGNQLTTEQHAAYQTPSEQYAAKLTTPAKAVEHIQDGSTLCLALAAGMPQGLAKAVADRILAGNLKDLNLYYQHSMKYSEETLICPEVLYKVNSRCFFMGDPDRKMVAYGIAAGKKESELRADQFFEHSPGADGIHPRKYVRGHRVSHGQIRALQPGNEQRLRLDGAAALRSRDRGSEPQHAPRVR